MRVQFPRKTIDLSTPCVMGVLNVTPDSFSDGGCFNRLDAALRQVEKMVSEGAVFIDVGGESTRPGAAPVSESDELDRVCPVVEAVCREFDVVVSLDTSTASVMREGVRLGAGLINDVRALERPGAVEAAIEAGVPVCVMHMRGTPQTMQDDPRYKDPVQEVKDYLMGRVESLVLQGVERERIILDPGFGFGKTLEHNLRLLDQIEGFVDLGFPVLAGISRKSMLGMITGKDVDQRLPASLSAAALAVYNGAHIIRAHDVAATVDAVKVAVAVRKSRDL
ncbi:dihydropteroate synthase [Hahella sp. CCB-MM4]|uniref:dihydropteroate synthase n=1 Tax=Hahella sp. (strain CCB-MM4) TaxID=1926491 RepID=UPI000B9A84D0|nr:dihydropteroate synthase [Hahella sp. CCB-MM4]OZG71698.1 dihydropteroate synthase [Hahella sp. CCB-MM4]